MFQINFQELARRFNVTADKNGKISPTAGASVKEYLLQNNVDLSRFKQMRTKKTPNARRKLKRFVDKVTAPTQQCEPKLKKNILD